MKKKSNKKHKKSSAIYKYIIFSLITIIIALSAFIGGYILNQKQSQKEIKKYQNTLTLMQQKINQLSKEIQQQKTQKQNISYNNSEIIDFLQAANKNKKINQIKIHKKIKTKKPKLVIIIDDVAFRYEVNLIKSIPFKITPSFFPPTKNHPFTTIYAKSFKDYMVHVPMQAINYPHPEPKTLLITDSYAVIKHRIDTIKKEFPKAHFINNHTGSRFTANLQAMNYLFIALKKDNLGFVDSMTTPYSKSKIVDKIYHIPLFQRDIFLDNIQNPTYIKNQLKKAIAIAKKRGYAIAIGHPHKVTLETLKNSKKLLNQVDVIYIDELTKYAKN